MVPTRSRDRHAAGLIHSWEASVGVSALGCGNPVAARRIRLPTPEDGRNTSSHFSALARNLKAPKLLDDLAFQSIERVLEGLSRVVGLPRLLAIGAAIGSLPFLPDLLALLPDLLESAHQLENPGCPVLHRPLAHRRGHTLGSDAVNEAQVAVEALKREPTGALRAGDHPLAWLHADQFAAAHL